MSIDETTTTEAPPKIVGKIETDFFCPHCHYNLFGLQVHRDVRLEIPVVRCPECGKFQAVGVATTNRAWLSRLAIVLIILWVAFIGLFIFFGGLAFFGSDIASAEPFLERKYSSGPYVIEPRNFRNPAEYYGLKFGLWLLTFLHSWIWAGALTVFLWQRKRKAFLLLMLVPILATIPAIIYFADMSSHFQSWVVNWIAPRIIIHVLIQFAGIYLGIRTGRAIARGILRVILTRRMLRHVHFLWIADNKTPPETKE